MYVPPCDAGEAPSSPDDQFYYAVTSGGSFDIDYTVSAPSGKVILDGQRERQGDYVLTANEVGEYAFCFENDMSTISGKLIDFDIMVESEPRREAPAKPGQISEQTSALEESVFRLNGMLMNIKRTQKQYVLWICGGRALAECPPSFHTRERRGFDIVSSTQK